MNIFIEYVVHNIYTHNFHTEINTIMTLKQGQVNSHIQRVMDHLRNSGGIYTDNTTTYMILKASSKAYPNLVQDDEIRFCFTPSPHKNTSINPKNIVVIVCRGAQKVVYPDMYVVGKDHAKDPRGRVHGRWILQQRVDIDNNMDEDGEFEDEYSTSSVHTQSHVQKKIHEDVHQYSKYRSVNEKQMGTFFGKFADHEAISYRLKPGLIYTPDFTYIAQFNKIPWILELKTSHLQFNDVVREKCSLLAYKTGIPVYLMAGNGDQICGLKFDQSGQEVPNKTFRPAYSPIFGIGWVDTNHDIDCETRKRWVQIKSVLLKSIAS